MGLNEILVPSPWLRGSRAEPVGGGGRAGRRPGSTGALGGCRPALPLPGAERLDSRVAVEIAVSPYGATSSCPEQKLVLEHGPGTGLQTRSTRPSQKLHQPSRRGQRRRGHLGGSRLCSGPSCPTVRGVGSTGSGNQSGALCSPESASPSSQRASALRVAGPRPLWRFTWSCDCGAPGGTWRRRRHRGVHRAPIIRRQHPHTRPREQRYEGPPKPSASMGRVGEAPRGPCSRALCVLLFRDSSASPHAIFNPVNDTRQAGRAAQSVKKTKAATTCSKEEHSQ